MYSHYYELYKDTTAIKSEVMYTLQECRDRCLHHGAKFLSEMLVSLKDVPPFFDYQNEDSNSVRFEFELAFTNLEDYLVYSKARAYFDLEDYPGCAHIAKYTNNSKSMFLHYMARYLCMHNENIYERTSIFETYKPLNMRKFMELLNELLILNVYGNEDDSEEESEDEPQLQETCKLDSVNQNNSVQQYEDNSTPKGRRCSRRPRIQRTEKATTTVGKKNIKSTKRNSTTKKVKVSTTSATHSEIHMSVNDCKEPRFKREDPYLLWLTAVMLKKIDRCDEAVELLVRALRLQPCHWGAWLELSTLIKDIQMLNVLNSRLTENNEYHWMHLLFIAHVLLDFQIIDRAINIYNNILNFSHLAFKNWLYLHSQLAIAYHNKRGKNTNEISNSVVSFSNIMKLDPYRIDNFDLLSNLLYVCECREEMLILAKYVASIDRYRQETLCVIGNMYSLKCNHSKAILYFKKAVRMNPFNIIAWTLLGHEYMELKNNPAAIISYRQALKINSRDYRAWYGLGQIYENAKLPNYSLYYIAHARALKPKDFRMLLTLGELYDRYDRTFEALICCYKALQHDTDGSSIIKLGKFYDKYADNGNQAACDIFKTLNKKAMKIAFKNITDKECNLMLIKIYLYLGHNNMDLHCYDRAIAYAHKCRFLCADAEDSISIEAMGHINALISEIDYRADSSDSSPTSSNAIKARRFLFSL